MGEPFIGSEAIAAGMSWGELQRNHTRIFRDVYIDADAGITATTRAYAGWLWSGRRAIVAGLSAAALHGSAWVDAGAAVELIHGNRHRLSGLRVFGDRLQDDEWQVIDGVPVTTPARTALDLGCRHPRVEATAAVDALVRATGLDLAEPRSLVARYPGRRGIAKAWQVLESADGGAQSPKETYVRLLLTDSGLPRPQTQIPVLGDTCSVVAYLDMGWPDLMVAVEYDGEQHRTKRSQYSWDVKRLEIAQRRGWLIVRVLADDKPPDILRRVRAALASRRPTPRARRPA
ncbi:hypothetical protein JDV09_13320 [Mycobacterium sp. Y57]|uniref:hypothetical protein n=1 Tax=Mycolicibacterium xanthum TaxID=2796469 RepID=UPI001C8579BF|nr:hypothetical protein [Mycolicibacterium xanthum]MBX7433081.1 hypothetical protein [Mycolicibacterium xanthum]